ncbi:MAG: hypothetical protein ABW168_17740 [Sedimenticola sp.]
MNPNYKTFLNERIEKLKLSQEIAQKNLARCQEKYKTQHDKRAKEPDFQANDMVWLYCTKIPQGQAPKLFRKWTGPYRIVSLGPHFTYGVTNMGTGKKVKSLINANRLKRYYDSALRPTNIPDVPANGDELNPEENADDVQIPRGEPTQQSDVTPSQPPPQATNNPKKKNKSRSEPTTSDTVRTQKNPDATDNVQSNQREKSRSNSQSNKHGKTKSQPNNQNSQNVKEPDTFPSPNNQPLGTIPEHAINKILKATRDTKGMMWYRIKWKDGAPSDWQLSRSVPQSLKQEFHSRFAMSGKRRKKPLPKRTFFQSKETSANESTGSKSTHTCTNDDAETRRAQVFFSRPVAEPQDHVRAHNKDDNFKRFIICSRLKQGKFSFILEDKDTWAATTWNDLSRVHRKQTHNFVNYLKMFATEKSNNGRPSGATGRTKYIANIFQAGRGKRFDAIVYDRMEDMEHTLGQRIRLDDLSPMSIHRYACQIEAQRRHIDTLEQYRGYSC